MEKKVKIEDILNQVKDALTTAMAAKSKGVAYMYVGATKVLSVSIENIENDVKQEAK